MSNYKYGSIFSIDKEVYILAQTGLHEVGLINLKTGMLYNSRIAPYHNSIEKQILMSAIQIPNSLKYISPSLAQLIKAKSIKPKPSLRESYLLESDDWEELFRRELCQVSTRFLLDSISSTNHESIMISTQDTLLAEYIESLRLHSSRFHNGERITYTINIEILRARYESLDRIYSR